MPPTKGTYVPMADSSESASSYKDAWLEFWEPPVTEFRYRYLSEFSKGSHGNLKGINYKATRDKSRSSNGYPVVRVHNCGVPFQLLVRLYTPDKTRIHPHKLVESAKFESPSGCIFFSGTPSPLGTPVDIELANLNVLHVGKEQVDNYTRQAIQSEISGISGGAAHLQEFKQFHEMCKEVKKEVENLVVLRVDLIVDDDNVIKTIYSEPISNSKTQIARQLIICRVSKVTGSCDGGEEVFLLTSKLRPEDINKSAIADSDVLVVFAERDHTGKVVWREFGEITYCHNLSALIFKTPPYRFTNIDKSVDVTVQLMRRSDPESFSEELTFRYVPNEESELRRKRAKVMPDYSEIGQLQEGNENLVAQNVVGEVTIAHDEPLSTPDRLTPGSQHSSSVGAAETTDHLAYTRGQFPVTAAGDVRVESENFADDYESIEQDDPADSRYVSGGTYGAKTPGSPKRGSRRKTKLLARTIARLRKRISN